MKVYVLYTSFYDGGAVHGVFSTRELAERALGSDEFKYGEEDTYIRELKLDEFEFWKVEV